jgi:hypothetical protein
LAVLRKNSLENRNTQIIYTGELPEFFDNSKNIYGYHFELKKLIRYKLSQHLVVVLFLFQEDFGTVDLTDGIDFYRSICKLGKHSSCKWRAE